MLMPAKTFLPMGKALGQRANASMSKITSQYAVICMNLQSK